ncbi:hypothetical protein EJ08DRAFT_695275 [Tothia fuscella]|uniref:Uncharacterized protein n=1 Tax=Tothia fuscella TaxID=1048955 RepID=A0A9P4NW62_9PEZI|nr:hypothetical protein EJ08DRAFT_695275 [Tothia fuscella]
MARSTLTKKQRKDAANLTAFFAPFLAHFRVSRHLKPARRGSEWQRTLVQRKRDAILMQVGEYIQGCETLLDKNAIWYWCAFKLFGISNVLMRRDYLKLADEKNKAVVLANNMPAFQSLGRIPAYPSLAPQHSTTGNSSVLNRVPPATGVGGRLPRSRYIRESDPLKVFPSEIWLTIMEYATGTKLYSDNAGRRHTYPKEKADLVVVVNKKAHTPLETCDAVPAFDRRQMWPIGDNCCTTMLSLIHTNKQYRKYLAPAFFSNTVFTLINKDLDIAMEVNKFLKDVDPIYKPYIRKIYISDQAWFARPEYDIMGGQLLTNDGVLSSRRSWGAFKWEEVKKAVVEGDHENGGAAAENEDEEDGDEASEEETEEGTEENSDEGNEEGSDEDNEEGSDAASEEGGDAAGEEDSDVSSEADSNEDSDEDSDEESDEDEEEADQIAVASHLPRLRLRKELNKELSLCLEADEKPTSLPPNCTLRVRFSLADGREPCLCHPSGLGRQRSEILVPCQCSGMDVVPDTEKFELDFKSAPSMMDDAASFHLDLGSRSNKYRPRC